MEAVTTLLTVIKNIVKAAEKAHQNRARCMYLADRVDAIGDTLREDCDSAAGSGGGGAYPPGPQTVRRPLGRLKATLDEALELVESCRESGLVARAVAVFTSESTATKLQDVDTRITACVVDLGLAKQIAARHRDHRHRANAEADPASEPPPQQQRYHAQSAPLVKQSEQPWPPSLQLLLEKYTAPPLPPFKQSKQPRLPSPQRAVQMYTPPPPAPLPPIKQSRQEWPPSLQPLLEQAAQPPPSPAPLPPIKQSRQEWPPSLQRFLEQAAQPPPPPAPLPPIEQSRQEWPPSLQRFLEQAAQPPPPPAPLPPVEQSRQEWPPSLQRFLEQAAQPSPPPLPPFKQSTQPLQQTEYYRGLRLKV